MKNTIHKYYTSTQTRTIDRTKHCMIYNSPLSTYSTMEYRGELRIERVLSTNDIAVHVIVRSHLEYSVHSFPQDRGF